MVETVQRVASFSISARASASAWTSASARTSNGVSNGVGLGWSQRLSAVTIVTAAATEFCGVRLGGTNSNLQHWLLEECSQLKCLSLESLSNEGIADSTANLHDKLQIQ